MAINANPILKFGVPIAVILGAAVMFIGRSSDDKPGELDDVVIDLTKEERERLNLADGDTPQDTVQTLVNQVKKSNEAMQQITADNKRLQEENSRLRDNAVNINQQINAAVTQKQSEIENAVTERLKQMGIVGGNNQSAPQPPASNDTNGQNNGNGIPVGLGMEGENLPGKSGDDLIWVEPDDVRYVDAAGNPTTKDAPGAKKLSGVFFGIDNEIQDGKDKLTGSQSDNGSTGGADKKSTVVPVYTIPANSILTESTAMTALIGRVPIDGSVTDPFPFKVIIGKENLMANDIDLPEVEKAIVSGTATGDWTLSCVKGQVNNITFIFTDGRVRTLPDANGGNNGSSGNANDTNGGIGWLSNPEGVPCITGDRKTNAQSYLATQFLLSGAAAAADSLSASQTTTTVDGGAITGALTGSTGQYVLGQGLSGGLEAMTDWVKSRFGQTFDAVYVPPGRKVAVHITKSLEIDYDTGARKVRYPQGRRKTGID